MCGGDARCHSPRRHGAPSPPRMASASRGAAAVAAATTAFAAGVALGGVLAREYYKNSDAPGGPPEAPDADADADAAPAGGEEPVAEGAAAAEGASEGEVKSLTRRLYDVVWNENDAVRRAAGLDELVDASHILVDPAQPDPQPGREGYRAALDSFRAAFPSVRVRVDGLVAEGDNCVAQLSLAVPRSAAPSTAVETSPKKASTSDIVWTATATCEWKDGRVCKTWVNSDALSALIQLGLLPDIVARELPAPFRRSHSGVSGSADEDADARAMVEALAGRSQPHPDEVITGQEWLSYYQRVASASPATRKSIPKEPSFSNLRNDKFTGLPLGF